MPLGFSHNPVIRGHNGNGIEGLKWFFMMLTYFFFLFSITQEGSP